MVFSSIAIKTTIPTTAPAATSGAVTFASIEPENWLQVTGEQYVNQSTSSVEFATPTGITITGGTQVGAFAAATNRSLALDTLDLRMEPGDVLAVALQTASSTATANVSINWHEE